MTRNLRFVSTDRFSGALVEAIPPNKFDSFSKVDNTLCLKSARYAMKSRVRDAKSDSEEAAFYLEFEGCVNDCGSSNGIGFKCGRFAESAACSVCRHHARNTIIRDLGCRDDWKNGAKFITILDDHNKKSLGCLSSYRFEQIFKVLSEIETETTKPIFGIGFLEIDLRRSVPVEWSDEEQDLYWSPHIHLLIAGEGRDEFAQKCKERFYNQSDRRIFDSKDVTQTQIPYLLSYCTKSPTHKKRSRSGTFHSKVPITKRRRYELEKYLLDRSLSDLIWNSKKMRFSRYSRIILPGKKNADFWRDRLVRNNLMNEESILRYFPHIQCTNQRKVSRRDIRRSYTRCLKTIASIMNRSVKVPITAQEAQNIFELLNPALWHSLDIKVRRIR